MTAFPKILPVLCAAVGMTGTAATFAQEPGDLSLVLLIGQSNMAGRGKIESTDTEPIPGAFKLDAEDRWVPALDPLHWDKPVAGVGPGREFARALLAARPGSRIGLIPAAVGGTSLSQWQPGGTLYNQALARLRTARKSGKLIAILWHQGESDADSANLASSYAERWTALMKKLREDAEAPDVPILVGELGEYLYTRANGQSRYARTVNDQIASLPGRLDRVAVISSRGLGHRGDQLHFDAASEREFGRRYAEAFLSLSPEWKSSGTP